MDQVRHPGVTFFALTFWLAVTLEPGCQHTAFSQQVSAGGRPDQIQDVASGIQGLRVPVGPPVPFRNEAPSIQRRRAPFLSPPSAILGGVEIGQSYDGIDFLESNCSCLPPDTNAAVGNNFVVETVNFQIRIFDKANGNIRLDEPLSSFFGAFSRGDPYVVYDDTADRWYVVAFDSDATGLFLAVSVDGNPLHGFLPTYHLTDLGGFPDYPKLGFNQDAIFISFNDFGSGAAAATIASIDKAAALSGALIHFVSHPAFQFRAMPPAQMHGDTKGGVEWFVSTDGDDFGGHSIRVTKMTSYLSDSPTFTYTSLLVTPYQNASLADQPGGTITTFPNTTTTQVHYRNGHLVTAMASGTERDLFSYPKGHLYQIDVSGGAPKLLKQRVIDPGPGVAVQMPSVDQDRLGNLGFTWMESSSNEYLSMWVGTLDTADKFVASVAAPGGGFFFVDFRIGDYSTTVLDPSDGRTFWSANEYIGDDGDRDIWRTHITSFTVPVIQVSVDIRGSINPRSHGVIQVTVLSTSTFDATTVDPLTVEFGPSGAHQTQKARIHDVNGDRLPDLALHFRTDETGIMCGDTSASLAGRTFDGQAIQGSDSFKTVGCNRTGSQDRRGGSQDEGH